APVGSQRCQRYVYERGDPVHVPVDTLSVCPTCTAPVNAGSAVATGTVVPFAAAIGVVGVEGALAEPAFAVAVTVTSSSCPTSDAPGVYASSVAPGIGMH